MITFLILCLAATSAVNAKRLHELFDANEIQQYFQNGDESVPEYEVAEVYHSSNDDDETLELEVNAYGINKLNLKKSDKQRLIGKDTPVYTVNYDEDYPLNLRYTQIKTAFDDLATYQDPDNYAAITVSKGDNDEDNFDGTIGAEYVIRSLPKRIVQQYTSGSVEFAKQPRRYSALKRGTPHLIFKKSKIMDNKSNSAFEKIKAQVEVESRKTRAKRAAPAVVYPEVLVVFDYSEFKQQGQSIKESVKYLAAFWNGVDLRYKLLVKPEIKINVAGILILKDEESTFQMLSIDRIYNKFKSMPFIDVEGSVQGLGNYFDVERRFRKDSFDLVVFMVGYILGSIEEGGVSFAHGIAYMQGVCKRGQMVAVIEDHGGFDGVLTATHEVGHLLGAWHDGEEGYFSNKCPDEDGFIMSTSPKLNENTFLWSPCSKRYISKFLNSYEARCLHNEPNVEEPIKLILPGKLQTLDQQCQKYHKTKACYTDERVCLELTCSASNNRFGSWFESCKTTRAAAAEGSTCGKNKHCIAGECVDED